MSEDIFKLIEAAKDNPDIFRKEYIYTQKQSIEINNLIDKIIENDYETSKDQGDALERLIDKIFKLHKIYKVKKNLKTSTNEIDLFLELDFFGDQMNRIIEKSCLENEVLIECKNYKSRLGVTWIGKFASLLRVSQTKVGLFISKNGITGQNEWLDSKGLIRKIALRDGNLILDFELSDFRNLEGKTLFDCLRIKKQSLEKDVEIDSLIEPHELEDTF
ncbi:hypothetical protein CI088_13685 [Enterococcus plantarum]|uniref:Restriction endonuclease type IV Mrr domain-containing protein n=1 Tax=Enterococcus plantarum TaxID=1077675 RepID=A0A2W4BDC5_9ENTE|nr:restriction endonuclease [Enterococcus plantarum]PZL70932.1 hypothetical protein CI088_13685 [Enterococcus plantarum]